MNLNHPIYYVLFTAMCDHHLTPYQRTNVHFQIDAVVGIYAKENGRGMIFLKAGKVETIDESSF